MTLKQIMAASFQIHTSAKRPYVHIRLTIHSNGRSDCMPAMTTASNGVEPATAEARVRAQVRWDLWRAKWH
jgi:hypothetical protein